MSTSVVVNLSFGIVNLVWAVVGKAEEQRKISATCAFVSFLCAAGLYMAGV